MASRKVTVFARRKAHGVVIELEQLQIASRFRKFCSDAISIAGVVPLLYGFMCKNVRPTSRSSSHS